jgi:hypothetical protein
MSQTQSISSSAPAWNLPAAIDPAIIEAHLSHNSSHWTSNTGLGVETTGSSVQQGPLSEDTFPIRTGETLTYDDWNSLPQHGGTYNPFYGTYDLAPSPNLPPPSPPFGYFVTVPPSVDSRLPPSVQESTQHTRSMLHHRGRHTAVPSTPLQTGHPNSSSVLTDRSTNSSLSRPCS